MTRAKAFTVAVTLLTILPTAKTFGQNAPEDRAKSAAKSWLEAIDAGKYSESWDAAAALLRKQVTRDEWIKELQSARSPLGKLDSREVTDAPVTKLPNNSAGQLSMVEFGSYYSGMPVAWEEIITVILDEDAQWRVTEYLILPRTLGSTLAGDARKEAQAEVAARSWVQLIDAGNYAESWKQASDRLKQQVTESEWGEALRQSRNWGIGKVKSRQIIAAKSGTKLPNTVAEHWVIIWFRTSFDAFDYALETVIVRGDARDKWCVVSYDIADPY
jgi:hypothetical protein